MMEEFRAYLDSTGDVDGAVLMLDKVVELAPDTETGRYASLFKIGILANKDRVKARVPAGFCYGVRCACLPILSCGK